MQSRPNIHWHRYSKQATLPEKLQFLNKLAYNCWWSWQAAAHELFAQLWPEGWQRYPLQPLQLLQHLPAEIAWQKAGDRDFVAALEHLEQKFEQAIHIPNRSDSPLVAYFCMEYGILPILKLYSGGLGILAGDYLKEASDQGQPLVAVGLWYQYGYFKQIIDPNDQQQAIYEAQDKSALPLHQLVQVDGQAMLITLDFPGRTLYAQLWLVNVGRVQLYLLDSDLPQNREDDRAITHHLYGGDLENRLKQELLLGMGGIQLLEKLGIEAAVYHYNEGHAAFAGLARLIQNASLGKDEALNWVRASSLFTTHTPVPAGHDCFPESMLQPYLEPYVAQAGWSWQDFMQLGQVSSDAEQTQFNMSQLACRLSEGINAVSALHGEVSRQLLHKLWPNLGKKELPIGHITNGVHAPSWTAPAMQHYLQNIPKDPARAQEKLWNIRLQCKQTLLHYCRERWEKQTHTHISAAFELRQEALTIGFARRFASYKRASLLFTDRERLKALMRYPIQFIFAGKAHPADQVGQALIRDIIRWSRDPAFAGRILFLEDYDITMAQKLVQGADVWLNTPTRPLEASGTSGMKATLNGVLNLSVLDGWWAEGYRPDSGWALPLENTFSNPEQQNRYDAELIYALIENELLPLWMQRDHRNLPTAWLEKMQNALNKVGPAFTMKRMLNEYVSHYYQPLANRSHWLSDHQFAMCRALTHWQKEIQTFWPTLQSTSIHLGKPSQGSIHIQCSLQSAHLKAESLAVHLVFHPENEPADWHCHALTNEHEQQESITFAATITFPARGNYELSLRVQPQHALLGHWDNAPYYWVSIGEIKI